MGLWIYSFIYIIAHSFRSCGGGGIVSNFYYHLQPQQCHYHLLPLDRLPKLLCGFRCLWRLNIFFIIFCVCNYKFKINSRIIKSTLGTEMIKYKYFKIILIIQRRDTHEVSVKIQRSDNGPRNENCERPFD
jgi:hypothetical protein